MVAVSTSNILSVLDEAISHMEHARAYVCLSSAPMEEDAAIALKMRPIYEMKTAKAKMNEALGELRGELNIP